MSATMEEQLCFEIKTILLAGHETSAAMLTWSLMELTRNPEALRKVWICPCHCRLSMIPCIAPCTYVFKMLYSHNQGKM